MFTILRSKSVNHLQTVQFPFVVSARFKSFRLGQKIIKCFTASIPILLESDNLLRTLLAILSYTSIRHFTL